MHQSRKLTFSIKFLIHHKIFCMRSCLITPALVKPVVQFFT